MASLSASFKSGLDLLFGDDSHEPPAVPNTLPDDVAPAARAAVSALVEYQNADYAELYLSRLQRFTRRRDVSRELMVEIARLLAVRMSYSDPIRLAQLRLAEVLHDGLHKKGSRPDAVRFPLEDLVSTLPDSVAESAVLVLGALGWSNLRMPLRFTARTRAGLLKLKAMTLLRRFRLQSLRYPKERALVERWLHMIDRSLSRCPEAALEIARTASIITGSGDVYHRSVARWHVVIDDLVKPVFDGMIAIPDLRSAVAAIRAAAEAEADENRLRQMIDEIKSARAVQTAAVT